MANTYKHKTIGKLRVGLPITLKEDLYIRRINNRHNFFDDREKQNRIKYLERKAV